jgi:hypothetical protein
MQMDSIHPAEPEVEGQRVSRSDLRLKQAVDQVEDALASLQELDGPEVEGQRLSRSDERLKKAIDRLDGALGELNRLQGALGEDRGEVEGQRFKF